MSTYGISPGYTQVLWSTGDTTYQTAINGAGKQWVRAMDGGCLFTDTFDIQYVPPPRFAFPTDSLVLCSSALPLSLKTDDCCASILWSSGDTTAKTGIAEPGWVWIHENNVCGLLRDSFFLEVVAPPHLDLGPDTVLCDAAQFLRVLSAPPGLDSYRWSTGSAGSDLSITEPGAYSVEVQNACGIYRDTFVARDLSDDILRLPADTVLCQTLPLSLSAEPTFDTYAWSTGQNTQQIEADGYGTYRVTVTNACGEQTASVDIIESNHPAVSLPPLLTVYLGDSIRLSPEVSHDKPVRYDWSPATGLSCAGCAEPFARPLVSGVFRVTVTDSLGCSGIATLSIRVLNIRRFYLPNVFSPNDDGENDSLLAYFGGEVAEVISARTYDRWGALVSERKGVPGSGMFEIWDGTHHGRPAALGVYAVVVDLRLLDGSIAQVSADVTVLR